MESFARARDFRCPNRKSQASQEEPVTEDRWDSPGVPAPWSRFLAESAAGHPAGEGGWGTPGSHQRPPLRASGRRPARAEPGRTHEPPHCDLPRVCDCCPGHRPSQEWHPLTEYPHLAPLWLQMCPEAEGTGREGDVIRSTFDDSVSRRKYSGGSREESLTCPSHQLSEHRAGSHLWPPANEGRVSISPFLQLSFSEQLL